MILIPSASNLLATPAIPAPNPAVAPVIPIALERPGAFCPNPVCDCPNPGLELIPVLFDPKPVLLEPNPPCCCGTVPPVCELDTELKGVFMLPG
jgi:hypothetical protein